MSDDFIPLSQSTPVHQRWQPARNHHQRYNNHLNQNQNGQRRGGHNNKWSNNSRSSYESNSSNTSYGQDSRNNIDAYLHPSMLQDPWAKLRQGDQA